MLVSAVTACEAMDAVSLTDVRLTRRRQVPMWFPQLTIVAAAVATASTVVTSTALAQAGGPRITELAGARDRPGLFTQRLVLPAHFCGPVHTHDQDLHGLVLRGTLRFGTVDSLGRMRVREYPAGSFVPIAAGRRHVEGSAEETEIHLSGIGPLHTTVVDTARRCDPSDAP